MKRTLIIAVAIVAGIVTAAWAIQNRIVASKEGTWSEVRRGDLVMGVEATGTLKAADSALIGPPPLQGRWQFKISMMAPEGAEVRQGQPVLGFDVSELQRELEEQRAERDSSVKQIEKARADMSIRKEQEDLALAEGEARLRKAEMKLEAPEELQGANERKQIELEAELARRETDYRKGRLKSYEQAAAQEIALYQVKQTRAAARVQDIEHQIERSTIRAPRPGTVVYLTNWRSEKKKVGDTLHRQETVMEIPNLESMMATAEIDEADAGRIAVGQRVEFRLDAHPDDVFGGTIENIARTVQRQSPRNPLKVLKVEIKLDRTDADKMRPGMRFRGTVETGRIRNVVLVPNDAVRSGPRGPVVTRASLGNREEVPVELGRRNDEMTEVRSGLEPGNRVLIRRTQKEEENGS
ncbi:MAG: efflux RND transporter periplasmic adaptor subunit [Thermoanaerobaculia bacterium]